MFAVGLSAVVFGLLLLVLLVLAGIPLSRDATQPGGSAPRAHNEFLNGLLFFPRVALVMASRLFTSGRRRSTPQKPRRGGLANLPPPLASLLEHGRDVEAAAADLAAVRTDHQRIRNSSEPLPGRSVVVNDRFSGATQRDYEDALVHVTGSLERWCMAAAALDDASRARLRTLPRLPDVRGLFETYPWLPRQVYEAGIVRFRDDLEACEEQIVVIAQALREHEDTVLHDRAASYR